MRKGSFGGKALPFYLNLELRERLPKGVEVLNPYRVPATQGYARDFFGAFYDDGRPRVLVLGINPGRFGAGLTGIAFTDPVALEKLGIANDLPKKRETSSDFIHAFIDHWGGPQDFYGKFFLTSVCPLGFTKGENNYNFYDEPALAQAVEPFILDSIRRQIAFGARRDVAIVLGKGKLQKHFEALNAAHRFFDRVCYLEHPRFILQYRRKEQEAYLEKYRAAFAAAYGSVS